MLLSLSVVSDMQGQGHLPLVMMEDQVQHGVEDHDHHLQHVDHLVPVQLDVDRNRYPLPSQWDCNAGG